MKTFKSALKGAFAVFRQIGHRADITKAVHVEGVFNHAYNAPCSNCDMVLHVELFQQNTGEIVMIHSRVQTRSGIYVWHPRDPSKGRECAKIAALL